MTGFVPDLLVQVYAWPVVVDRGVVVQGLAGTFDLQGLFVPAIACVERMERS
jgi:hypothetical protein